MKTWCAGSRIATLRALCAATLVALAGAAMALDWSARPLAELAIYPEMRVPAVVEPLDESRLSAEVAGRIEALPARVGLALKRGDLVARLDERPYRLEVARVQAQIELIENRIRLAESQLAQAESLAGGQFLSAEALKVRRTEVAVLRSERDAARQALSSAALSLERTVIRAPFDGVVRERMASLGELAAPGTPLVVLAASGAAEVRARVPVQQLDALRGAAVRQLVAGRRSVALEIVRVSPLVDPAGQTREVILSGAEPLAPGLAGELRWRSPTPHLPPEFVQSREGRLGAYVREGGAPAFRALPQAEVGRAVAVDWPLDTEVIDQGRRAIGLEAGTAR